MNGTKQDRFIVYGLTEPGTECVRYIGKSASGLKRPKSHRLASRLAEDRSHKGNWIRSLLEEGRCYGIVVLESAADGQFLQDLERFWIAQGTGLGWRLTNHTKGGDGTLGVVHGPEARAAYSARAKAWQSTAEAREMMSQVKKDYFKQHPEALKEQSQRIKALYVARPEVREALVQRARNPKPEWNAKKRAGIQKYWSDPETRKRRSLAASERAKEQWKTRRGSK